MILCPVLVFPDSPRPSIFSSFRCKLAAISARNPYGPAAFLGQIAFGHTNIVNLDTNATHREPLSIVSSFTSFAGFEILQRVGESQAICIGGLLLYSAHIGRFPSVLRKSSV
jgi:hypothetical protein